MASPLYLFIWAISFRTDIYGKVEEAQSFVCCGSSHLWTHIKVLTGKSDTLLFGKRLKIFDKTAVTCPFLVLLNIENLAKMILNPTCTEWQSQVPLIANCSL
jgi:hypothetical protein